MARVIIRVMARVRVMVRVTVSVMARRRLYVGLSLRNQDM